MENMVVIKEVNNKRQIEKNNVFDANFVRSSAEKFFIDCRGQMI